MLESLEQSNIKRMSVENPEKQEWVFDPEKEIGSSDWEALNNELEDSWEKGHYSNYIGVYWNLKKIKPDLDIELKPDTLERVLNQDIMKNHLTDSTGTITTFANLKEIFGNLARISEVINSYSGNWIKFANGMKHRGDNNADYFYALTAADLKRLGISEMQLGFTNQDYEWLREELAQYTENPLVLGSFAVDVKRLRPDEEFEISEEQRKMIYEAFKEEKQANRWSMFSTLAANLYELNSKQVNKSIEIGNSLPEQRNF